MASTGKSLRLMVDHWLGPAPGHEIHVTAFRNKRFRDLRYVCVETVRAAGPFAMFFFRHRDGSWCIYPPDRERPMFRTC
jgi:hypothetical protein